MSNVCNAKKSKAKLRDLTTRAQQVANKHNRRSANARQEQSMVDGPFLFAPNPEDQPVQRRTGNRSKLFQSKLPVLALKELSE